jgi:Family of unknown function (DUF6088)
MKQSNSNSLRSLKALIMQRINNAPQGSVWTPEDFLEYADRQTVDKILQRLVISGELRRISRGLYDKARNNLLTGKTTAADYRKVIEAIERKSHVRILIDGITAANDLGLTNAVPAHIVIRTDGRVRPIQLGNLVIEFKLTAASKLYWAGRPAMRIVQALHWVHEGIKHDEQITQGVRNKLLAWLRKSPQRKEICEDLQKGLNAMPLWMRRWIEELLAALKPRTGKSSL